MQLRRLLTTLLTCLALSSCASGPKLKVCVSDPVNAKGFDCHDESSGADTVMTYAQAAGFKAYAQEHLHALLDYCAKRTEPGTPIPTFSICTVGPENFSCQPETCEINPAGNGLVCHLAGSPAKIPVGETDRYVAFMPSDEKTLLDLCNIQISGSARDEM